MITRMIERIRRKKEEKEDLLAEIDSLKDKYNQLETCLTEQIKSMSIFRWHETRIINRRAMMIINTLMEQTARNEIIYLDSGEIREILENCPDRECKLMGVSNPYKAVIDVIDRVIDYADKHGLAITKGKTIGKKMWSLTYVPKTNPEPVLKSIAQDITERFTRKVKKSKTEMKNWAQRYTPFFREFNTENYTG